MKEVTLLEAINDQEISRSIISRVLSNRLICYKIRSEFAETRDLTGRFKVMSKEKTKKFLLSRGFDLKDFILKFRAKDFIITSYCDDSINELERIIIKRITKQLIGIRDNEILLQILSNSFRDHLYIRKSTELEDKMIGIDMWLGGIPVQVKSTTKIEDFSRENYKKSYKKFSKDLDKQRSKGIFSSVNILVLNEITGRVVGKTKTLLVWYPGCTEPEKIILNDMGNGKETKRILNNFYKKCLTEVSKLNSF